MHPSSCGDMTIAVEPRPAPRDAGERNGGERIGGGMIVSLLFHVVAILLIVLLLPRLLLVPPADTLVPIDLVRLGDQTASLDATEKAALPQERARETATAEPAEPVPVAAPPPPPPEAKPEDAKEEVTAGKQPIIAPQAKPEPPRAKAQPKSEHPAALVPPPQAPPVNDLAARLQSLARQQQLQARLPPNPRQQEGAGASNVTASSDNAAPGRQAIYDVKDFIRVQILRHWRPDVATLGAGEFVIAIHLTLNRDGSVGSAEIVDDPRYGGSAAYRSLALSARNAALLASPLTLPQGRYDAVRDMTLNFSARDALR
jgi:outer membrane biosynthesis protein TonB